MNNEPVAWMGFRRHGETRVSVEKLDKDDIPLYTHPVKELTDEEILELWKQAIQDGYTEMIIHDFQTLDTKKTMFDFAKAILRKAQEK